MPPYRCILLVAALSAPVAGCGGDDALDEDGGADEPQCQGDGCGCPAPLTPRADGQCVELAPEQECPAGTMGALGARECRVVGWAAECPLGMHPDASGWGCQEVQPAEPCSGANMEVLGQSSCRPIGDCQAQFPPEGATVFVDDGYGAGDLDATHFATIGEALAASEPGAIVAVEAGTYLESLSIPHALTLVGRCAEQVIVQSPGGGAPGVKSVYVDGLVVRGLTLRGHKGGVALMGGEGTVEDCLIEDSIIAGVVGVKGAEITVKRSRLAGTVQLGGDFGANLAVEDGSNVEASDSAFVHGTVNGVTAMGAGSHLSLTRCIVRDTRPDVAGEFGKGLAVSDGATATIVESAFTNNLAAHVAGHHPGTRITISRSVLRNVIPDAQGLLGNGVELDQGASAEIDDTAIVGSAGWGLLVADWGGALRVQRSVVRGPMGGEALPRSMGAVAVTGASMEITDTALLELRDAGILVQDPTTHGVVQGSLVRGVRMSPETIDGDGYGILIGYGAAADVVDSTVLDNDRVGVVVGGVDGQTNHSFAHVTSTLVAGSRAAPNGNFGRGMEVIDGAELVLDQSAIVGHLEAGINVGMPTTRVTMTGGVVRGTKLGELGYGHGVLAQDGAALMLQDTYVLDNGAVGLIFSAATGGIAGVSVADNVVGIHAQDGSVLEEVSDAPHDVPPLMVRVARSSRFVDNDSRVGSGSIPIPKPMDP